jgi:hypothetical protein
LQASGLPVELYIPSAKKNAEEWPVLVQYLTAHTVVLPKHARLREELLNLTVEMTSQGIRVLDKGSVHQDHAVAVRGVVAMLATSGAAMSESERLRCLSAGALARPGEEPAPEEEEYDDWSGEVSGLPWGRNEMW